MHWAGPVIDMDMSFSNPNKSEGHRQGQTETDRQADRETDRQTETDRTQKSRLSKKTAVPQPGAPSLDFALAY